MSSRAPKRRAQISARLAGAAALGLSGAGLAAGFALASFNAAAQGSLGGTISLASAGLPSGLPGFPSLPSGLPSFPSLPGAPSLPGLPSPSSLGSGASQLQSALQQGQEQLEQGLSSGQQQLQTLVSELKSGQLPSGMQCLPLPAPPSLPDPLSGLGSFGLSDTAVGSANGQGVSLVIGLSSSKGLTLCAQARNNSVENFRLVFDRSFVDTVAKRVMDNEDIARRFFDDEEFKQVLIDWYAEKVYRQARSEG